MIMEKHFNILALVAALTLIGSNIQSTVAGRYLSRNRACDLLLPPNAIVFSTIVSNRTQCIALIAPIADACCSIYDAVAHNCTIARTDRFQLVLNASASLEVGIDSVFWLKTFWITFETFFSFNTFMNHFQTIFKQIHFEIQYLNIFKMLYNNSIDILIH